MKDRIVAEFTPLTSTTLLREASPLTIRMSRRGIFSASASTSITSSFAAPSTGGACTQIFSDVPCRPTIPSRLDRGCTRTVNRTAPSRSVISSSGPLVTRDA